MSDHSAPAHPAPAPTSDNLFTREDLEQFDNDDTMAGKAIGKMLAIIFLYTIFAMSVAATWTLTRH